MRSSYILPMAALLAVTVTVLADLSGSDAPLHAATLGGDHRADDWPAATSSRPEPRCSPCGRSGSCGPACGARCHEGAAARQSGAWAAGFALGATDVAKLALQLLIALAITAIVTFAEHITQAVLGGACA